MMRAVMTLACLGVAVGLAMPAAAQTCPGCKEVADKGEGWCCSQGMAYGVKLASQKLYDALTGTKVKEDEMKCPGCRSAAKSDGVCSYCNVGVAKGKAYRSMVAYRLAKGKAMTADDAAHCPACKSAWEKHGRCEDCNVGFVAHRAYKNKKDHDLAVAAYETLTKAAEFSEKCEGCAVAMVTDGTCARCKTSFKDGKKAGKASG